MNIVTDAIKDDRVHNVRKADQIHNLVGDLALGIVDTILGKKDKQNTLVRKQKTPRSPQRTKKKLAENTNTSEEMLQKALTKAKQAGKGTITATVQK